MNLKLQLIVSTVVFMAIIGIAEIMGFNPVSALGAVNFINLILAFYIALPITFVLTTFTGLRVFNSLSFFGFTLVELAISVLVFGALYEIGFSLLPLFP